MLSSVGIVLYSSQLSNIISAWNVISIHSFTWGLFEKKPHWIIKEKIKTRMKSSKPRWSSKRIVWGRILCPL